MEREKVKEYFKNLLINQWDFTSLREGEEKDARRDGMYTMIAWEFGYDNINWNELDTIEQELKNEGF